jgi:adenine-specific DNA-methyltransferase
MVQLPEHFSEDSETFKAGYKTIADIGKERIRRVIKKLDAEQESEFNFDNNVQDRGFRVLKLDQSNFKQWRDLPPTVSSEEILEQLEMFIDHVSHTATQEDLLFEILLKAGFMPTEKIEHRVFGGKDVFSIVDGELMICLEDNVTNELIEAIIEAEPKQFICLDSAFDGNDQLKANTVQTFEAHNMQQGKQNQIIFRTI